MSRYIEQLITDLRRQLITDLRRQLNTAPVVKCTQGADTEVDDSNDEEWTMFSQGAIHGLNINLERAEKELKEIQLG